MLNKKTTNEEKKYAVLAYMGADTYTKLFDRISPEQDPNDLTFDEIVAKVKDFTQPDANKWAARIAFRKLVQTSGEPLLDFESRLRKMSIDCNWPDTEKQLSLIEQFIAGLTDRHTKQALMVKCKDKTKFSEVFACADEIRKAQKATSSTQPTSNPDVEVNALRMQQKRRFPARNQAPRQTASSSLKCYRCGNPNHLAPKCPHINSRCDTCGVVGHLASACRKKRFQQNFLEECPANFMTTAVDRDPIIMQVRIHGKRIDMELDTGCALSTMPYYKLRQESSRIINYKKTTSG
ncbi:uncharacterized protein LOC108864519 [Galendromus occidentalis]|uniref:Uncharacterized protein LOC108864519 n=1 Tax=Galendromus occidentalis TaxID=34638 RepID=A0AAJ7PAP2_9ACAR|nr:uncharacterized protein LOC108864519 [Galendromus occidentalis]